MKGRFLLATVGLTAVVAFLVGLIVAGSMVPAPAASAPPKATVALRPAAADPIPAHTVSFADIAERLNPAVVNIDATSRGSERQRRRFGVQLPDSPDLFER